MRDQPSDDSDGRQWMPVGRIAGAFGVHGEIKVDLLTDFPDRFKDMKQVYVGPERRPYHILTSRRHRQQVLLTLQGLDTPEDVALLRQMELAIPRTAAVDLPEGHYYLQDVIGMAVLATDGAEVGVVTDVLRTGSNDVFVVNEGPKAVLIPVIHDAIAELDLAANRVVVERWVLDTE